jgi:YD repeat-containing protein
MHDAVGNPSSVTEGNGDRVSYSYDALNQLTREQRSGDNAYDITYTYDPVGNRLTKLAADATTTYTYDAANELVTEALAWPLRPCEMPLVDLMARHRTLASLKCDINHTFEAGGRGGKGEDTIK